MGASDIIMDRAKGCIKWVILVVSRSDRNSSLVTSENNWGEHGTMGLGILSNLVL